ncbi:MAG: aspartate aminotransferase family protein [Thaumarchaeota archaeon]|nr:aspartate aminotransferase family protein [Nitrososphaerota archaeon]|tara:strand:+ start:20496 stop:21674 length:1179 start_codon:yes stop_codon:yes gene_type:complete
MNDKELIDIEDQYLAPVYQKFPIILDKGEDCYIWDSSGKKYLDLMAGYGVSLLGHSNERIVKAISDQAKQLTSCHGSFYNEQRANASININKITPKHLNNIYLCNSGAEAVEAALKLCKKHSKDKIISMSGSYHGKTIGSLSLTWSPKYKKSFQPLLDDVDFIPFGDSDSLSKITSDTGAVFLEVIQGENGVKFASVEYFKQLQEQCKKHDVLLVVDEIQTGLGRTGKMWAHEHYGLIPDILCIGKGLAGGMPVGAMISRKDSTNFSLGEHTTTFGGNPLTSSAINASIEFLSANNVVENAAKSGQIFLNGLKKLKSEYDSIRDVRGLGLMLALESKFPIKNILFDGLNNGLIMLYSGRTTLRFLPPLTLTETQVNSALQILDTLHNNSKKE